MCCFTRLELRLTLLLLIIVITFVNGFSHPQERISPMNYKRFSSRVPVNPSSSTVLWNPQSSYLFSYGPGRSDQTQPPVSYSYTPYRPFQVPQESAYTGLPFQSSKATQPNFEPVPQSQHNFWPGMAVFTNAFLNPRASHVSDMSAQRIQPSQRTSNFIQWIPQPGERPYFRHRQNQQTSSQNVISRPSQGNDLYQRPVTQHPDVAWKPAANSRLLHLTTKAQELERPTELNRRWRPSSVSGPSFSRIFQSSTQQQPDPKFSATSVAHPAERPQWSQYLTRTG